MGAKNLASAAATVSVIAAAAPPLSVGGSQRSWGVGVGGGEGGVGGEGDFGGGEDELVKVGG